MRTRICILLLVACICWCSAGYGFCLDDSVLINYYDSEARADLYLHKRDNLIDNGLSISKFSYDDFVLLSNIIMSEAGMNWIDRLQGVKVGEVVLNRVASVEFPNTIREVIYEYGQYGAVKHGVFDDVVANVKSMECALFLLNGGRVLNDLSVVFQSNYILGSGISERYDDPYLGSTYFCYSYNKGLY